MTTLAGQKSPASSFPSAIYAEWRAAAERELKGASFEKRLVTHTPEGIEVQPLYRREDVGTTAGGKGRTERPWPLGAGISREYGHRWEVCSEPAEYEFSPLPALAWIQARPRPGAPGKPGDANLSMVADPLGWLLLHGTLPMPLVCCLDDLADGVKQAEKAGLSVPTVGIGARVWHESGATAVQELSFALATGADYWRALLDRGLSPGQIAARTHLCFAVGVDFFMEVAKLRAARLLWAKMSRAFGADLRAQRVALGARTARWDKTVQDCHVNLLRLTTQGLAAVVGGADTVDIRPFDEVTGQATELGTRMARNLHDILAEEFHLGRQVDPAGGAWYVEALTDQLGRRAWALFQEIEKRGGMAAAIAAGYPQDMVARAAAEKQALIDTRRQAIVGTTVQPDLREAPGPRSRSTRPARTRRPSASKSIKSFAALLAAAAKRNSLPALRLAWTRKRDPGPTAAALKTFRAAEGFEAVRRAGDDYLARHGRRAQVFLARMGPPKQHQARADFVAGFFAVGGWEIEGGRTFTTAEEAADAAVASGATAAVLCSTDDTHPALAPAFARRIKTAKPALVVILAGAPGAREPEYRAAGYDDFIHVGVNVRTTLARVQRRAGILP